METLAFKDHDHAQCIANALGGAESICEEREIRFTPLRRRVLELVWQSHGPIGAYEVLDRLRAERRRAEPPTVYRALQFLGDEGFIHRIESLNAYVGCPTPERRHNAQYLICSLCGEVVEIDVDEITSAIHDRADDYGFKVRRQTVEVVGLCSRCHIEQVE